MGKTITDNTKTKVNLTTKKGEEKFKKMEANYKNIGDLFKVQFKDYMVAPMPKQRLLPQPPEGLKTPATV